jgi:hypothetical protein
VRLTFYGTSYFHLTILFKINQPESVQAKQSHSLALVNISSTSSTVEAGDNNFYGFLQAVCVFSEDFLQQRFDHAAVFVINKLIKRLNFSL